MLINREEYQRMFEVEEQLWWYKSLHERVIDEIQAYSKEFLGLNILDAGCGTGGLLTKLRTLGLKNIQGFDYNDAAVEFSQKRGLSVSKQDITNFSDKFPAESFDIVVSNDVLYQFDDKDISSAFDSIFKVLKPGGVFISNNNAFSVFWGTHDIAVGSKRRFVLTDFQHFLSKEKGLKIVKHTYWSILLSPLILSVRLLQRLQLALGLIKPENVKSDVSLPSDFMNKLFYGICDFERKNFKKSPFGSSLFLVMKKG